MEADEPAFEVRVSDRDPRLLSLHGGLDVATVAMLRAELVSAIDACGPGADVVVDVSALDFIDSTGLGAFVAGARRLHQRGGGSIVLRAPRRALRYTLQVAGLERVFVVED